jgi:hypothetical protein
MKLIDTDSDYAPACWASYLINGDASGLTDEEHIAADDWLHSLKGGQIVDCSESTDFRVFNGLLTEVALYTYNYYSV